MKSRISRYSLQFGIFLLYFLITCLNYNTFLTNKFTPGGDGKRIYPYLKYLEKVPEKIPLWHAHKHHGYPLIADPENHMPWSLILDTESSNFNIHLNLIFLSLTSLFAFSFRSIARKLGLSQIASFAVGIVTIFCVPISHVFLRGTLTILLDYVLAFIAINLLMQAISKSNTNSLYLIPIASIMLSWCLITSGYYIVLYFYIPAIVFLMCFYSKEQEKTRTSIKKIVLLLGMTTVFYVLFSLPVLLPVIDGIVISQTFAMKSATIDISSYSIFNHYLGLWPFIILALLFSRGLLRKYSYLLLIMASINYLLILFKVVQFNFIFDLWKSTPILKNIRWQHLFIELSSIASAFSFGIFLDSCREKLKIKSQWRHYAMIVIFILLLLLVAQSQYSKKMPVVILTITFLFIAITIIGKRFKIILTLCIILSVIMITHFRSSPYAGKLKISENLSKSFRSYAGRYTWNRFNGWDKFSPIFPYNNFSMLFLREYRLLISILYKKNITVQRPHWIYKQVNLNDPQYNNKIAQLMAKKNPKTRKTKRYPFPLYDNWIIADDNEAVSLMKQDSFSHEGQIILSKSPGLQKDNHISLIGNVILTGKTAETLSLQVKTNKNSILMIPEIYHRDWQAKIDEVKVPLIKAYASLRAIAISPGEHIVSLKFVYKPYIVGKYIAGCSIILILLFFYFFKQKLNFLFPNRLSSSTNASLTKNQIHKESFDAR